MKYMGTFSDSLTDIEREAGRRVLVLDGAMGTMIMCQELGDEAFRVERNMPHSGRIRRCNDLLCLTRPDVIRSIHEAYLDAGADIIETNTFNANAISLAEYGLADEVEAVNRAGAALARDAVERHYGNRGHHAWVAGCMGPTNVSLSMHTAPCEKGAVDFCLMAEAMRRQAEALLDGGVDVLLIETIFDTLNAKAAISGVEEAMRSRGRYVPIMISITLTPEGHLLSGQSVEAFLSSISPACPMSVGLNCGYGSGDMSCCLEAMQGIPALISFHPNAEIPDEKGLYPESPEDMARTLRGYLDKGWLNIVGGCCGTTPAHIAAIAREAARATLRPVPLKTVVS